MKVGIVIPTRGDERKHFVENCLRQMRLQSYPVSEVVLINEKPKNDKPDITYRYRIGCEQLKNKVDLIFFIEDDDWYSVNYIEAMVRLWKEAGQPEIFGLENTVYYNIITQKYTILSHPGRASMMNTMIKASSVDKINWGDDNYSYIDIVLWQQLKGKTAKLNWFPCIGIKHGIGLCGGGGHVENWRAYDKDDKDYLFLSRHIDKDSLNFYRLIVLKNKLAIQRYQLKENPFLTIITRVMWNKRKELFEQHRNSLSELNDKDFEQIFIIDKHKVGMLNANSSFQLITDIKGKYVYLLDDDDFITNPNFIDELKKRDTDVIFFKMKILTGDGDEIYPKPESFGSREPKRGQIGGSCFVVKKEVYLKYIKYFSLPSFGDWNFITNVMNDNEITFSCIDLLMSETGRVSHGKE